MLDPASAVFQFIRAGDGDEARDQFYDWVHATVLPSIFVNGGYLLSEGDRDIVPADDLVEMPLPPVAEAFLSLPVFGTSAHGRVAPDGAQAYDEAFFRTLRALGDHPAVRDLNAYVDSVLLPGLFANPELMGRASAPAEDCAESVLDI